jgi:hypothetical protein
VKARYHREAREEPSAAAEWYEARRPGQEPIPAGLPSPDGRSAAHRVVAPRRPTLVGLLVAPSAACSSTARLGPTYRDRLLGLDFVAEVIRGVASIREHPETWPRWQGLKTRVPVRNSSWNNSPFHFRTWCTKRPSSCWPSHTGGAGRDTGVRGWTARTCPETRGRTRVRHASCPRPTAFEASPPAT